MASTSTEASADRLEGNEAYKAGDYEKAIRCYAKALAAGDATARLNRAAANFTLSRFGDAIVDLAAEPTHSVKSLCRLSKSLTSLGALAQSEMVLDVARELLATSAEVNAAALIREAEDLLRPATEVFGGAIESDLVFSYGSRKSVAEAEAAVDRLIKAANALPFSVVIATALGYALLDAGRLELAAAVSKALIAMVTSSDDGKLGPVPDAINIKTVGDDSAAATTTNTTLDLSGLRNVPPAISILVLALLGQGDIAKAQQEVGEALSRDPDAASSEGKSAIGWKKALSHVTKAKEAANELYTAKNYSDALNAYTALVELCKEEFGGFVPAFAFANLAAARLALGTLDEANLALDDVNNALRVWPFNPNKNGWLRKITCLQEASSGALSARAKQEAVIAALEAAQHLTADPSAAAPGSELATKLFNARTKAGEDDGCIVHPENDAEAAFALDWSASESSSSSSSSASSSARGAAGKKGKGASASSSSSSSSLGIPALSSFSDIASFSREPSNAARLKIVDAFAEWCGPCKALAPVFEKMAVSSAVPQFVKIDGDKSRGTMGKLGVRAFPTLISFLDGKELDRLEGADPRRLEEMVKSGIAALKRTPKKGLPGAAEAATSRSPAVKAVYGAASSGCSEMSGEAVAAVAKAMMLGTGTGTGTGK